ncbi:hypothetical protein Alches_08010 [Alicyclobacillus hesperidum subsp. aegles]|uniref:hypothetical protein n=1 Tax=Alicyclobacillus hesperidum TaxID=89784 RepID=UPI0007193120|nr:hypothetical protein [Alicyclobacillus hesperidum]KRW91451.1 hypothetical protein SD51_08900 [Alicyclobacillus tengchongensis]GLG00762.1 hypothetical protein Alches_08010 [Alicyclobacillus hesperidum subsp. aegles]
MVTCPICNELLQELTSVHCMTRHGMTKSSVIAQYGKPKRLFLTFAADSTVATPTISPRDFLDSQLLSDRLLSKTRKFHI